ncbi:MAG: 4Fe-4S dicluster domain-containing protein [Deltaproteobacteria bacterium]|nr:4Fe-4S dicluster domain-containing protein [Deltaproteobacteria bacterium]
MSGKAFFIDTTLCMACRGCQIACKKWNQLPATETKNYGSYQNPMDLSFFTFKLVRFQEHMGPDNKPVWYFFPDQCRHCVEPPCMEAAEDDAPGGIVIDSNTGAVLYTNKLSKANSGDVIDACPFNIPRAEAETGLMAKCTMCYSRVNNGLLPACVKTCPTGAMNFGDRDKMVALAEARLKDVKAKYPKAEVTGLEDLRVFYLLADDPAKYYEYASADRVPGLMDRQMALKKIGRSLRDLTREWRMINHLTG